MTSTQIQFYGRRSIWLRPTARYRAWQWRLCDAEAKRLSKRARELAEWRLPSAAAIIEAAGR